MDNFDQTQAFEEGWCISQCSGTIVLPEDWFDIQRIMSDDYDTPFNTDLEAQAFVYQRAAEGSAYHRSAISAQEDANFRMVRKLQGSAW